MTFVHSCFFVSFLYDVCPQLFVCWFSVWRLSTVVSLLVFCVAFVDSCFSVGFLCGVYPQLFVCWFSVWRLSTVVCLLVCGVAFVHSCLLVFCVHRCLSFILSFSGVRVGLMFSFLCGVCPQLFVCWFSVWLCPQLFVSWFTVWPLSTVVCLLVFCVAFVHSCLSVGFLCAVCPQLFVYWFSVWRLSTVASLFVRLLLVFALSNIHHAMTFDCTYIW